MPKKTNPKKKKVVKKVMTVEIPKQEAPALDDTQNIIAALASMQASAGWAIMVRILNDNIKFLETAILDKVDPKTKRVLSDEDVEMARIKRSLNIEVRDTPQNYGNVVREMGQKPIDYDPYFKTNDEIKKARQAPPADDRG